MTKLALVVAILLLGAPLTTDAQQPARVPRVGFLTAVGGDARLTDAFRSGLQELGYTEGQNVVIEWRAGRGALDRLPQLAADRVASHHGSRARAAAPQSGRGVGSSGNAVHLPSRPAVPERPVRSLAHLQDAEFLYEAQLFPDQEFTFNFSSPS
jgi:hypothetical protein